MIHKETNCIIKIDKEIAPIIQYILTKFMFEIVPLSSCQDTNNEGMLFLYVRTIDALDRLRYDLFDAVYDDIIITYSGDRLFSIKWPVSLNQTIVSRIKNL